jgi:hypothetical protein
MNRTLKDATVRRYYYNTHDQLRGRRGDLLAAYNFARRLKTLRGLTPYEYICKIFTGEPQRFRLNPLHQMPGLNKRRTVSRLAVMPLAASIPSTMRRLRGKRKYNQTARLITSAGNGGRHKSTDRASSYPLIRSLPIPFR